MHRVSVFVLPRKSSSSNPATQFTSVYYVLPLLEHNTKKDPGNEIAESSSSPLYNYQFPSVLCFSYFHIGIILCIVNLFSYISTIEATDLDIKWGPMESAPDIVRYCYKCMI